MPNLKKWLEKYPALAAIGNTPLIRINLFEKECPGVSIFAKCELANPGGSLKDRPVRHMLLAALESGELAKGKTILDSSSGNAGIAYAAIGAMLGFPVEIVLPGNASVERKKRIQAHGAKIIETDPVKGYDEAIRVCHQRHQADPKKYFLPDQYKNANNWHAHFETTAAEILKQVPETITHFVSGVGTGGTITGCGRRLKEAGKDVQIVLADAEEFPGIEGLKSLGPGNIIPEIFDQTLVDQKIAVGIEPAAEICRKLALKGLFVGQSSGAYLHVAYQVAKKIKKGCIVTLLNDIGERYFSTRLWD
ncbi:MAG: PLP-dependent cysteine synthase family protein [Deltaproteobacteria bacterium]|nr:PLP-dependent cysteine synthase family protein [Deltaproteobacteria bacterium]